MTSAATTPDEYVDQLPDDRKPVITKLRKIISEHLPNGFEETISYGALSYVVPHSIYPDGYHCKPTEPLPFAAIASQKHSINFYHMGIYADEALLQWFISEYPNHTKQKLDMGKSCIRFKKFDEIPYKLIGELMKKMTVTEWINIYITKLKK